MNQRWLADRSLIQDWSVKNQKFMIDQWIHWLVTIDSSVRIDRSLVVDLAWVCLISRVYRSLVLYRVRVLRLMVPMLWLMLLSTGESINIFRGPLWGTVYTWHCITRVTLLYWDDVWHGKSYTVRPPDGFKPSILMPSMRPYRLLDGMGLTMALGGV